MSTDSIPFLDLPRQHTHVKADLIAMFDRAVSSASFVGGSSVTDFEAKFAAFCGAEECVGVANGTDALMLALRALGVGHGDVVIVPAHTFIATAEAVSMLGAIPRFVDCDPVTYTIAPESLAAIDSRNVKAVIPVHLYGQAADMDEINAIAKQRGWQVIEDCAQAHGAKYRGRTVGSLGDLAAFSFYPGKNLGALGDAGAVVGTKGNTVSRLRSVANHGRLTKYEHGEPGVNSRLDAIQAAALGIKLPRVNDWNAGRARVATWYEQRLGSLDGVTLPKIGADRTHVFHLYVVQVPDRDRLGASFDAARVGWGFHYPLPLHLQPAYQHLGYDRGAFPSSERIAGNCFSLPMFPELTEAQVDRVCALVTDHVQAGA
jgi:dTDP-4-amino-4,6-dideoxygalactose transaminase